MGVWLLFLSSTFNIWSLATVSTPQICSSKILWLPLAMAKTSAISSTHGSSRPGLWATPLRLNHRLKVMKSEATVGWRRWWCNLRSTPSFIMMRLSVIQKSCVLVAGFSYNRKRVTSLNKNWKLLIIDAWRQKKSAAAGARSRSVRSARRAGQPLFLRDYSTLVYMYM